MGRVYQTPQMLNAEGKPAWCIDYTDEHGKRKRVRTDACTKKDAQRALRSIETEIDTARALGLSRQALTPTTFSAFAETEYLPEVKSRVRGSTYSRYEDLYAHLKSFFGSMSISSISTPTIEDFLRRAAEVKTRLGRIPSNSELNHYRMLIGAILQLALKRGLVQGNPARLVEARREKRAKRHIITLDQEQQLLGAAPSWLCPFITVGLYGGLRESEIAAMKWEHIKDGFIYIPDSKTGEDRYVPINAELKALLDAQTHAISDGGHVPHVFWDTGRKSPYKGSRISERFSKVARKLGIPATFHSTRATFITRARYGGVSDAQVMAIVGQSSVRMLDLYTNMGREHLQGCTERLCANIGKPVANQAVNE